nr:TPA_asm: RNA-dependent RNA polymerase [Siminarna virus]
MSPIATPAPRRGAGWEISVGFREYIPEAHRDEDGKVVFSRPPRGTLFNMRFHGQTLWDLRSTEEVPYFNPKQRKALFVFLTRNFGIRKKVAQILVDRPKVHILRIEGLINGVIDSLVMGCFECFDPKHPDHGILKHIIRKIFLMGASNPETVIRHFKEMGLYLFHLTAKSVVIGGLEKPKQNMFWSLMRISSVKRIVERSQLNESDYVILAALRSSRQFPYLGEKTEKKAVQEFKEVLVKYHPVEPKLFGKMVGTARRLGAIARHLAAGKISGGSAHFSVTSSGEFSTSISQGGEAQAMMKDVSSFLAQVHPEAWVEEVPWKPFKVNHLKGIPQWKYLFRPEVLETEEPFGAPRLSGFPKGQVGRLWGYDEALGRQIYYVAWKKFQEMKQSEGPRPRLSQWAYYDPPREDYRVDVRAEVVPEMGNKARIVTISPWWVQVLQSTLAHPLIELMKFFPQTFSSFHRQDQAWSAAMELHNVEHKADDWLLSSDLKNATNAQNIPLTREMLRAFLRGAGAIDPNSTMASQIIGMIGPRRVHFKDGEEVISRTGILMGEPLAKPGLTLLNLCITHYAILVHLNKEHLIFRPDRVELPKWHFVHIGGDDHLVHGPKEFLDLVTKIHQKVGSQISPGQHGRSQHHVMYTEKLLIVSRIGNKAKPNNGNIHDSIMVDSVKIRLLERGFSTLAKKDNKNVAIGKAMTFMRSIPWLPKETFTREHKLFLRDLFMSRMGVLLPKKLHPHCYASILLPAEMGGLSLALDFAEEYEAYKIASGPLQWLCQLAKEDSPDLREAQLVISKLNRNPATRGVPELTEFRNGLLEQLRRYPNLVEAKTWSQIKELVQATSNTRPREVLFKASHLGYISFSDFVERALRGAIFQRLLCGKADRSTLFNGTKYRLLMKRVYDTFEQKGWNRSAPLLSPEEYKEAKGKLREELFLNVNLLTSMDIGYLDPNDPESETFEFVDDVPIGEVYTRGLPTLMVGFPFVGLQQIRRD